MKNVLKKIIVALMVVMISMVTVVPALAAEEGEEAAVVMEEAAAVTDNVIPVKALSAGITIAVVAAIGAVAMALSIMKSVESMARQPEAAGDIRSSMMLGLVFIETAIIYALIVAILVVFVL